MAPGLLARWRRTSRPRGAHGNGEPGAETHVTRAQPPVQHVGGTPHGCAKRRPDDDDEGVLGAVRRVLRRIVPGSGNSGGGVAAGSHPCDTRPGESEAQSSLSSNDPIHFAAEHLDDMFERLVRLQPSAPGADDAFAAILSAMAVLDQLHRDCAAASALQQSAFYGVDHEALAPIDTSAFPAIRESVPHYTPALLEDLPQTHLRPRKLSAYAFLPERTSSSDLVRGPPSAEHAELSSAPQTPPGEDCAVHILAAIQAAGSPGAESPLLGSHSRFGGTRSTLGTLVDTPVCLPGRRVLRRSVNVSCAEIGDTPRAVARLTLPATPTPAPRAAVSSVEDLAAALAAGTIAEAL